MQYIDLEPFEKYLQSRGLVKEDHICHYSRWVLRFLRSGFDLNHSLPGDLLQCFSDQLARDESVLDWQLKQAMRAAELYLNVFLREQNGERSASDSGEDKDQLSKADAIRKMQDLLKLRHYSKRTEKTYTGWVSFMRRLVRGFENQSRRTGNIRRHSV